MSPASLGLFVQSFLDAGTNELLALNLDRSSYIDPVVERFCRGDRQPDTSMGGGIGRNLGIPMEEYVLGEPDAVRHRRVVVEAGVVDTRT